jgi:UDP-glucose 4-epimerase
MTGKLYFSSSCTVYGQAENRLLKMHRFKSDVSLEIPSKLEEIITDVAKVSHINAILLRYFNPIETHPSAEIGITYWVPQNLVPFITQTGFGLRKELSVYGDYPTPDGTAVRDYIHVVDLESSCHRFATIIA